MATEMTGWGAPSTPAGVLLLLATYVLLFLPLVYFGLLTWIAMIWTRILLDVFVVTLDFSVWYSSTVTMALATIFALAAFGFYTCVEWRSTLASVLQEE